MKKRKFKKFLLLLSILTCLFTMTACQETISYNNAKETTKKQKVELVDADLKKWSTDMITYLDNTTDDDIKDKAEKSVTLDKELNNQYVVNPNGMNAKTVEFYNSWVKTREDLGKLKSIDNITVEISDDSDQLCTIDVNTTYEQRKCDYQFVIAKDMNLTSGAINPTYTTGEKMEKAVLNTLLGMGTVFIVLIFISFVIAQLKHLNKIGQKKTENSSVENQGVDNAINQIVSNEEENEADDSELVAAIAAAIAAYEGTSPDGLVVRSIKRVNKTNNWRR